MRADGTGKGRFSSFSTGVLMAVKTKVFQDFRGINRTSDRLNAPPDFLYDLLNGYIKKDVRTNLGMIQQRSGSAKFNSNELGNDFGDTKKIRVLYEAKWDGGSTDLIIRAGTAWGKYDSGDDEFDAIDTSRTDDADGQCAMFKNEVIMVDGGKARKMASDGTVSDLSADTNMPDKSDCVWVHRDKVWLNDLDAPMVACFSKTNAANGADSWTGTDDAGTIDLSTVLPVGDRIRGFRTYGGSDSGLIAIICDKYTVVYSAGANVYNFNFVQYFPTTCLSIHACDYVGNDIVYPSRNELTSIMSSANNNQLETAPLSNYIVNLWRELADQVIIPAQISGVFHKKLNHYYITFPITGNYQTLVFSADIKNFVGRWVYPFDIYSWCERNSGVVLAGGNGYVYTINTGTDDDGTAIPFKACWPALYFDDPSRFKKPTDFEALFYAENADPSIVLDYWYGGVGTLLNDKLTKTIALASGAILYYWDESYWDESYWAEVSASYLYRTRDLLGRGRCMFIDISNNTLGAILSISYLQMNYILEGNN